MQSGTVGIIVFFVYLFVLTGLFTWKKIERLLNLTSRQQVMTENSWNKLNRLWEVGQADLSTYGYSDELRFSTRVSFKEANDSTVSNSFHGSNVNDTIDKAYKWSVTRGFIKEK